MIKEIVIHCSATPNGRHHTAQDIHRQHKERGIDVIGYHYLIRVHGIIDNGRPEYWSGTHASGHNKGSIGVCMIGTDNYNEQQWRNLRTLIAKLSFKYQDVKVIGHNEISKKTCPGFDVQKWLASIGIQ